MAVLCVLVSRTQPPPYADRSPSCFSVYDARALSFAKNAQR
jgi:hypothetical protein